MIIDKNKGIKFIIFKNIYILNHIIFNPFIENNYNYL